MENCSGQVADAPAELPSGSQGITGWEWVLSAWGTAIIIIALLLFISSLAVVTISGDELPGFTAFSEPRSLLWVVPV